MAAGDTVWVVLAHYRHGLVTGVYSTAALAIASIGTQPAVDYEIIQFIVDTGQPLHQSGSRGTVSIGTVLDADAARPGIRNGKSVHSAW